MTRSSGAPPSPSNAESAKQFYKGTHRIRSPEETWASLVHVLPQIGITRVADITALDRVGIPVYQAVRPRSRNLSVSQGKGVVRAAACVSAVMEAIELWHAERLDHLPQVRMSVREMRYSNAIPLPSLRWSSGVRYLEGTPIRWVPAHSLTGGHDGWLPRQMLELDSRAGRAFESQMFDMSSNGLASGNCIEEALVHALCELVERHAMYLIDREPEKRLPVDQDSIDPPYCQDLIRKLRAAGMKLAIYDLTWEVDLPCLMVRLAAPDFPHVWIGFGCHPAKDIALSRAITEAAQSRLTYISGARDDLVVFSGVPDPSQAFEAFAEPPAVRTFADLPDRSTLAVGLDLVMIIDRLQAVGCQPFYVDLLRPGIDIPVVIAFVPGLREVHHG